MERTFWHGLHLWKEGDVWFIIIFFKLNVLYCCTYTCKFNAHDVVIWHEGAADPARMSWAMPGANLQTLSGWKGLGFGVNLMCVKSSGSLSNWRMKERSLDMGVGGRGNWGMRSGIRTCKQKEEGEASKHWEAEKRWEWDLDTELTSRGERCFEGS